MSLTTPFLDIARQSGKPPRTPMRISSVWGVSHQGCGGGGASFENGTDPRKRLASKDDGGEY
jgi:hypothetical protein